MRASYRCFARPSASPRRSRRSRLIFLLAFAAAACSSRPARFADRPAAAEVLDAAPIRVPSISPERTESRATDAHIRRVVLDALDPERFPDAGDVNALDEVPRSSWFAGSGQAAAGEPPVLPISIEPGSGGPLRATDARGRRATLVLDPPDRPETRTAAVAIASRLVRALGWRTPDAHVLAIEPGAIAGLPSDVRRAAVVTSPEGVDLGPTPPEGVRADDPNDRVPHEDRRTLRALRVLTAWLALERLYPSNLRDVYVGPAGRGHVRHHLVGLDGAFGLDRRENAVPLEEGALERLASVGLVSPPPALAPSKLDEIAGDVSEREEVGSPPLYPASRCSAADAWWAAKRIAALSAEEIEAAVASARFGDPRTAKTVLERILERRRAVVARAAAKVTPLELDRVDRASLVLVDRAIAFGVRDAGITAYEIEWLRADGEPLTAPSRVRATRTGRLVVAIPTAAGPAHYAVLRVRTVGQRVRPLEVHVAEGRRAVGVRH